MSKTIKLTYTNGPWKGNHYKLDGLAFARAVRDPGADLRDSPSAWMYAGLLCFTDDGEAILSPRGEDLLASIDSIPDDPEPEKPMCKACGNTGKVYIIGDFANDCTEPLCVTVQRKHGAGPEWQTTGLPDIGREVEVVIVTGGETLRGRAGERDEATCALFLTGEKSAPTQYRPLDGWWTRPDASDNDDRRLRWRYVS